eukprot:scaffold181864_cov32-Tisochrysis_lutea.AAC.2
MGTEASKKARGNESTAGNAIATNKVAERFQTALEEEKMAASTSSSKPQALPRRFSRPRYISTRGPHRERRQDMARPVVTPASTIAITMKRSAHAIVARTLLPYDAPR